MHFIHALRIGLLFGAPIGGSGVEPDQFLEWKFSRFRLSAAYCSMLVAVAAQVAPLWQCARRQGPSKSPSKALFSPSFVSLKADEDSGLSIRPTWFSAGEARQRCDVGSAHSLLLEAGMKPKAVIAERAPHGKGATVSRARCQSDSR